MKTLLACALAPLATGAPALRALGRNSFARHAALGVGVGALQVHERAEPKDRRVSKIVALLKDMLDKLEGDQAEDESTYEKMACWCATNEKEKAEEIATATARITNLTNTIEATGELITQLDNEIEEENAVMRTAENSRDEAMALRLREQTTSGEEQASLAEAITSVKAAITVLEKHHSNAEALLKVASLIQGQLGKHKSQLRGIVSAEQLRAVSRLVESQPTVDQYAEQSGNIFGILTEMLHAFESDLKGAEASETAKKAQHDTLMAAKDTQIKGSKAYISEKEGARADAEEARIAAIDERGDTQVALVAYQKFEQDMQAKCSFSDEEWELRKKTRADEMAAVKEAISVLNSDEAFAVVSRTFNPASFVQKGADSTSRPRAAASRLLAAAANRSHSPQVASLALLAKDDTIAKVRKMIGTLVEDLKRQQDADRRQKVWCVDNYKDNELRTQQGNQALNATLMREEQLEAQIEELAESIDGAKQTNADLEKELTSAGNAREAENQVYQSTIADQMASQSALKAAVRALQKFYGRKDAVRSSGPAGPATAPEGFKAYENQGKAPEVISLLQTILNEAAVLEGQTRNAENDAQSAYEAFASDTNTVLAANIQSIETWGIEMGEAETNLAEAKEATADAKENLDLLAKEMEGLAESCDFLLRNYEIRQKAFMGEMAALHDANLTLFVWAYYYFYYYYD